MKTSTAVSPCHITGLFQIFDNSPSLLHAGSRGAGVCISNGVKTTVKAREAGKAKLRVMVNGLKLEKAEVSEKVVEIFRSRFEKLKDYEIIVEHYVDVPVGAGFGTSGAAALSLSLALNDLFNLGLSKVEAAQLAHVAEVECKTGLGTVIAETFGGAEIRVKPGAPGIGVVRHLPVSKDHVVVCVNFDSLLTKEFLTDKIVRNRINGFGGKLLNKLMKEANVSNFMKFSRQFAEHVGLITENVRKALDLTDSMGVVCSMPMFGESVFTLTERENAEKLVKKFRDNQFNGRIFVSEIDFEGARLLNEY